MVPFVLISSLLFCLMNGEQTIVPLKEGEVTLPFSVNPELTVKELRVVWRHGEYGEKTVFSFQYGGNYNANQDKQFQGRVSFCKEEIAKGNVSLMLHNVTQNDAGIYTCLIFYHNATDEIKSVSLVDLKAQKQKAYTGSDTITKLPETRTNYRKIAVFGGGVVLVSIIIGFVIYRKLHKPISVTVKEGENAILPFNVKAGLVLLKFKVVRGHGEHMEKTVFTYHDGEGCSRHPLFQGRVSVFKDETAKGKLSLKLTNVTQNDAGIYTCLATYEGHPEDQKQCSVNLVVQKVGNQEDVI